MKRKREERNGEEPIRKQAVEKRPEKDYIFSDDGKKPLTSRRFLTLWREYAEQTGISCKPHQLRHSFATIAVSCGVPMKTLSQILGHKQISTTMDIYADVRADALKNAADILSNSILNEKKPVSD